MVVSRGDDSAGHLGGPPEAGCRPPAGSGPSVATTQDGSPEGRRRVWRLPVAERPVPRLRRGLSEFLCGCDLSDDDRYDVLLAACEAVSNGIEHAQHPREPCVDVMAEIGVAAVTIVVRDHGKWREGDSAEGRGRGMAMMWILADTRIVAGPQGTTVTIRSSPRHRQPRLPPHGERGIAGGSPFPPSAVGGV